MDHLSALFRRFLADEPYRRLPADELWAKVRDGLDEPAVRVLLERAGGRIHAVCRALTADPERADEAFQETFCALVRHRAKLPTYRAAVAWLYTTARSQSRLVERRHRRWLFRDRRKAADTPTASSPEAGADAAAAERRQAVLAAVSGLPAAQRRAVELVYLEGMTHAEAAEALGWSRGAVGKQVQRGLDRLRRNLGGRGLLAAGGATVLVPELSAEVVERVAGGAVARAAGSGLAGWKLVATGLIACAAVSGGLAWERRPADRQPIPVPPPPAVATETVPERTLRLFRADVLPRMTAALEGMPGHPAVRLVTAEAFDTRLRCEFESRHESPPLRIRFGTVYDTRAGTDETHLAVGGGRAVPFDPWQAVRIELPFGRQWVMEARPFAAAIEALRRLPNDDRTADEKRSLDATVNRRLAAYAGDWLESGDPDRPCRVEVTDRVVHFFGPAGLKDWVSRGGLRLEPDGRVLMLGVAPKPIRLSADGQRLTFEATGEFWTRRPIGP